MPELPEVETVMRGLAGRLEGRAIRWAELRRPDLRWAVPAGFAARLNSAEYGAYSATQIVSGSDCGGRFRWSLPISNTARIPSRIAALAENS